MHIYVDDMLVTGNNDTEITFVLKQLHSTFLLKDLGDLNFFLGIEAVTHSPNLISLNQSKYIKELLYRTGMQDAKPVSTPMIGSSKLSTNTGTPFEDPTSFRSIVGELQYVTVTRPDIVFAVNKLNQFMSKPSQDHWMAPKRVLRYLAGTVDLALQFYKTNDLRLTAFSDSDWTADVDDRRFVFGYCVYFIANLIF
ncbi:uncharacterized mitochondrial protein AtMg00810-like [Arachis hypogaea]|uniref:uncharacterized mitochondrial protein AtMg00810-like n=1 Tax=Arachis hypogaea TaxID=3818 RepID=UPI003B20FE7E